MRAFEEDDMNAMTAAVEVRLAGRLTQYTARAIIEVAPGRSVLATAAALGIPRQQPFVAIVNGRTCDLSAILAPGDRLTLLPPIAGG
jgi:molybdopterin converting factor small subunit